MNAEPWEASEQVAVQPGMLKMLSARGVSKTLPAPKIGRLWKFQRFEVEWVKLGGTDEDSIDQGQRAMNWASSGELDDYRTLPLAHLWSSQ